MSPEFEAGDRLLGCAECAHDFLWTAGEQAYYRANALAEPRRCPPCRQAKRERFEERERRRATA